MPRQDQLYERPRYGNVGATFRSPALASPSGAAPQHTDPASILSLSPALSEAEGKDGKTDSALVAYPKRF